MKISLCQINLENGNLKYNFQKIKNYYKKEQTDSDIVAFPELSLSGYLLKDLVKNHDFLDEVLKFKANIIEYTKGKKCALLFGCPILKNDKIFNSVIIAYDGEEIFSIDKHILPNYEVFNEPRNFSKSAKDPRIFKFKGEKIGILICEDAWHDNIPNVLEKKGVTMFLIINASPFDLKKQEKRIDIVTQLAIKYELTVAYLNTFGAYDELVFDGGSLAIDKRGKILCELYLWKEKVLILDTSNNTPCSNIKSISEEENIYQALVLSVRDF
jgi:NAD+ synthase (glutamine-hydrolysing)